MSNIRNGIVGYLAGQRGLPGKDGNPGVWVGTEPPESSEYEVWVNPTGEPFTAEWENVENKPFETLSDDFEVDSDGVLSVVGGSGGASSWEDLEDKPFESIGSGLSVDGSGALNTDPIDYSDIQNKPSIPDSTSDLVNDSGFITSSDIPDWSSLDNKPFESIGSGLSVDGQGVLSATGGGGSSDWDDITNKPFDTVGAGLTVDNGEIKMQVPIEVTTGVGYTVNFNQTDDTLNHYSGDWWPWRFDYSNSQTKIDNFCDAYIAAGRPGITIEYDFEVDGTTRITGSNVVPKSDINVPSPSTDAFEVTDLHAPVPNASDLVYRMCINHVSGYGVLIGDNFDKLTNIYSVTVSFGGTQYTSKLPIDAIDCDSNILQCTETNYGTYTLKCDCDGNGNYTYYWDAN